MAKKKYLNVVENNGEMKTEIEKMKAKNPNHNKEILKE